MKKNTKPAKKNNQALKSTSLTVVLTISEATILPNIMIPYPTIL